jgi:uncharacterized membrane protein
MQVDVVTSIQIDRPRNQVAAYAADPENATNWYSNIREVEWKSPRPLTVGSRLGFVAGFLGRRLEYTYEVREWIPRERLVMATSDGPFAMETTYRWEDSPTGGTVMTLRNRGTPSGFSNLTAPFLAGAMRRANRKDLIRLKALLESDR